MSRLLIASKAAGLLVNTARAETHGNRDSKLVIF